MKTRSAECIESLSAQYVLGVLKGAARRRFEREMMYHWQVRQEVWYWERQFHPLLEQAPAVAPPTQGWDRLSQRLWPTHTQKERFWQRLFWQGWSLAATTAVGVLAMVLYFQTDVRTPVDNANGKWLAVVQSAQAEPLWLVDANTNNSQVRLKALAAPAAGTAKDYELWLIPKAGVPQSIGVLPSGDVELTVRLSTQQLRELLENRTLAISLEPKGGSPTGLPTGPVVYQSHMLKI